MLNDNIFQIKVNEKQFANSIHVLLTKLGCVCIKGDERKRKETKYYNGYDVDLFGYKIRWKGQERAGI